MRNLPGLADALKFDEGLKAIRKAKITAVDATNKLVTINLGGSSVAIAGVAYAASYLPQVNDIVMLLELDSRLLVLGAIADASHGPPRLLTIVNYRPGSVTDVSTASTSLGDVDATNLKVTFTFPASGNVLIRLQANVYQAAANNEYWGLRSGSSDVSGSDAIVHSDSAGSRKTLDIYLAGTPGTQVTYKWAYKVNAGTGHITYGGNDGPALMEVWSVD